MKKIIPLTILISCYLIAPAQTKLSKPNKHSVSIGYGYSLDTKWWRDGITKMNFDPPKTTNDLYLKYEYALKKKITVGMDLGFTRVYKDEFGIFAPLFETYAYIAKAFRLLTSLHYHFLNNRQFDPYINIGAGFYSMKTKHIYFAHDPNPLNSLGFLPAPMIRNVINETQSSGADLSAGIGIRYVFFKHLGLSIETGINRSVFQIGVTIQF